MQFSLKHHLTSVVFSCTIKTANSIQKTQRRDIMADNKENRITIRVSDKELEGLKGASEKDDRTVASFVRTYALKAMKEQFGEMQDLIEEEKLIAKREEVLKRKMDIEYKEFQYDTGQCDPINRI